MSVLTMVSQWAFKKLETGMRLVLDMGQINMIPVWDVQSKDVLGFSKVENKYCSCKCHVLN